LDVHSDVHHNRSVFTVLSAGSPDDPNGIDPALESGLRQIATSAIESIDFRNHQGVHPRIGVLDVVPFVSLRLDDAHQVCDGPLEHAISARDAFMAWAAEELSLPCFSYGPERSLPEVRRGAFETLAPDIGPPRPHPTAGACAVGARPLLVAYNLWLSGPDLSVARSIVREIRGPAVRALALVVGGRAQVSCNLIDPFRTGPAHVYDQVARLAESSGSSIEHAELVGLAPLRVVEAIPKHRRPEIGLDTERTIEARLASCSA
jgi:glutamate formiminotransferase / 5-formyltetrahydrofolate cyclo-ligase